MMIDIFRELMECEEKHVNAYINMLNDLVSTFSFALETNITSHSEAIIRQQRSETDDQEIVKINCMVK